MRKLALALGAAALLVPAAATRATTPSGEGLVPHTSSCGDMTLVPGIPGTTFWLDSTHYRVVAVKNIVEPSGDPAPTAADWLAATPFTIGKMTGPAAGGYLACTGSMADVPEAGLTTWIQSQSVAIPR